MLGELTDSSNQHLAFPIYGLFWPLGAILGLVRSLIYQNRANCGSRPLIGGSLSKAATRYPKIFGYELLRKFPYLLPCLVAALIAACGSILGYFFLEEVGTLPYFSEPL